MARVNWRPCRCYGTLCVTIGLRLGSTMQRPTNKRGARFGTHPEVGALALTSSLFHFPVPLEMPYMVSEYCFFRMCRPQNLWSPFGPTVRTALNPVMDCRTMNRQ